LYALLAELGECSIIFREGYTYDSTEKQLITFSHSMGKAREIGMSFDYGTIEILIDEIKEKINSSA